MESYGIVGVVFKSVRIRTGSYGFVGEFTSAGGGGGGGGRKQLTTRYE